MIYYYTLVMDLYHADIRLPDGFCLPNRITGLTWTNHADRARHNDRYGEIPKIPVIDLGLCKTIEVGMENGRVKKIVVRTRLDYDNDIVLVLIPGPGKWLVKTVWINERNDSHSTLNRSHYMR